jgi:hypothetical protein
MNYDFELSAIRGQAIRYCHKHEITDHETFQKVEHAMRHEAFMRAIEPYVKQKAKLHGFRYLKHFTLGKTPAETEYEWSDPEIPKMLAQWDELIADEAKRYGLAVRRDTRTTTEEI